MRKCLLSITLGCVIALTFGCSRPDASNGPDPYNTQVDPTVTNDPDQFVISFTGHVEQQVDRRLSFSSRKVKLSIISGDTYQAGDLIIQLYLKDGSMPYSKTIKSDGQSLTISEIFSLDSA